MEGILVLEFAKVHAVDVLIGAVIGMLIGIMIGWIIRSRTDDLHTALDDLKWSQLIGACGLVLCLLLKAPEAVTIAVIALIPSETVALEIANRGKK